jgi:hypothetical protein
MILQHNKDGFQWYEFDSGNICYINFDLSGLLLSLPESIRTICLTQLN